MKVIQINNEARLKLRKGVDTVANIVKNTLGPSGRNVVIGSKFTSPVITNDGISIAKAVELEDEIENLGVQIVREASQKTNDRAGDGTTTAMVLAQAIITEGFNRMDSSLDLVKSQANPIAIKREIDRVCELVVTALKQKARPIKTLKELEEVAFISVENKEIGDMIAKVVYQVGKDGVVKVEESDTTEITSSLSEGMEIESGYVSKFMATNENLESIETDVYILVTNGRIDTQDQLTPIAEMLNNMGVKSLVIFAEGYDETLIKTLVVNRIHNKFRVLAVKPSIWNKGIFEDICIVTGATLIDIQKGMNVMQATPDMLAQVKKVISTSEKTTIIGGNGKNKKDELVKLKSELKATKAPFEKQKIEERIARVTGSVAVIHVGATTETERKYLKDKIDDAVNATKCALDEGVVKGGGLALKEIADDFEDTILTKAIGEPYRLIQANAGGSLKIRDTIIDPVKVTRIALETACSIAGILLTTECAIAEKNETDTK